MLICHHYKLKTRKYDMTKQSTVNFRVKIDVWHEVHKFCGLTQGLLIYIVEFNKVYNSLSRRLSGRFNLSM